MNKYIIGIIGGLLAISSSSAKDNNYYIKAEVGVAKSEKIKSDQIFYKYSKNKSFNSGPVYSLGFGYKINDKLRSEVVYSYTDLKYKFNGPSPQNKNVIINCAQKVNIQTGMINLFYDVATYQKLTPYIGFGLGYAKINPKEASLISKTLDRLYKSNKSENLTYALMGGLSINVTDKINFDIGYKFQDFGKVKPLYTPNMLAAAQQVEKGFKIKTHSGTIGVRYSF
jgi:opacity protein-like surface antigen